MEKMILQQKDNRVRILSLPHQEIIHWVFYVINNVRDVKEEPCTGKNCVEYASFSW